MEASFASELVGQEEDRGCTKIMSLYSWADALKQLGKRFHVSILLYL